jgi:hypothetical protein
VPAAHMAPPASQYSAARPRVAPAVPPDSPQSPRSARSTSTESRRQCQSSCGCWPGRRRTSSVGAPTRTAPSRRSDLRSPTCSPRGRRSECWRCRPLHRRPATTAPSSDGRRQRAYRRACVSARRLACGGAAQSAPLRGKSRPRWGCSHPTCEGLAVVPNIIDRELDVDVLVAGRLPAALP